MKSLFEEQTISKKIDIVFFVWFFISFWGNILASLFMLSLFYYWRYSVEGCIKVLVLLTLRGLINPAIASGLNSNVKWVVLIGTSIWLIIHTKLNGDENRRITSIVFLSLIFVLLVGLSSFLFSSYPITSVFKLISFIVPFLAIIQGFVSLDNKGSIINYIVVLLSVLFIISALMLPFDRFRIINNDFQGIFSHVSVMGIMSAVFLAYLLFSTTYRKIIKVLLILLTFILCYFSASRTGMISCILIVFVFFFIGAPTFLQKVMVALAGILILVVLVLYFGERKILQNIFDFLWKNSDKSILDSRKGILEESRARFLSNQFFGTGFMVPYTEGIREYGLIFNLVVEPGNILYMLLGDTGIIGIVLFGLLFFTILFKGKKERLYLFVGAFIINMGEMVFFSTNNMSILLYILLAAYMFGDSSKIRLKTEEKVT